MCDSPIIDVTLISGDGSGDGNGNGDGSGNGNGNGNGNGGGTGDGVVIPVTTYVAVGGVAIGALLLGLLVSKGSKRK